MRTASAEATPGPVGPQHGTRGRLQASELLLPSRIPSFQNNLFLLFRTYFKGQFFQEAQLFSKAWALARSSIYSGKVLGCILPATEKREF